MKKEDLLSLKQVVTHEFCSDGIASAMIIRDVLPNIEVTFCTHGTKPYLELEAKPGMLFCDIIPPPDRVDEFIEAGSFVLDHHKGVADIVKAFGSRGVFADINIRPGVSGAVLAWEEIWCPLKEEAKTRDDDVRRFKTLIGIRDTWQNKSPDWEDSRIYSDVISFFPPDYWLSQNEYKRFHGHLASITPSEYDIGKILIRRHDDGIKRAVKGAFRFEYGGISCAVLQGSKMYVSDASEILRNEGVDLVGGFSFFCEDGVPIITFSVRTGPLVDAAMFCNLFGGNGHARAAGFIYKPTVDEANPYVLFKEFVARFLQTDRKSI